MAVSPVYSIHRYTDEIYKVVAFKGHRDPDFACLREEAQHYDTKLDNSFSRARSMVLQYALCNCVRCVLYPAPDRRHQADR